MRGRYTLTPKRLNSSLIRDVAESLVLRCKVNALFSVLQIFELKKYPYLHRQGQIIIKTIYDTMICQNFMPSMLLGVRGVFSAEFWGDG